MKFKESLVLESPWVLIKEREEEKWKTTRVGRRWSARRCIATEQLAFARESRGEETTLIHEQGQCALPTNQEAKQIQDDEWILHHPPEGATRTKD